MATTLLRGGAESKGDAVGKVPVSAPRPLSTETNNYLVRQALSYPPLKRPKAAKKYLKHNCEGCRKAQTKCDRTSPVCRRCNRRHSERPEILKYGNLNIWEFGIPQSPTKEHLNINISSAQHVVQFWISSGRPTKNKPDPFSYNFDEIVRWS